MSNDHGHPPPGGWGPPPPGWTPPPAGPTPPAGTWGPPTAPRPVHRPGAVPLRPLGLGDLYDAAFRTIRHNPQATVGAAVLVAAVAMVVPVLVTSVLTFTVDLSLLSADSPSTESVVGFLGSFGALGVGTLLQQVGLILVAGMVAHVVAAAAVGRRLSLGEAWRATAGQRLRLVGLAALLLVLTLTVLALYAATYVPVVLLSTATWQVVVYAVLSGLLLVAFMTWFWIRVYYLPAPALMMEGLTIRQALRRGYGLTRGAFWRTFGIALLTVVLTGVASSVLTLPFSFGGQLALLAVGPEYQVLGLVLLQALSTVVSTAFVAPFTTAVTALQYLDLRIRREAYDVDLMTQAGITRP